MRTRFAGLVVVLFALVLVCSVLAADVTENDLDKQMLAIAATLRCTVCQNQSVADSSADIAGDMRGIILDQLRAGKTPDEIKAYFVQRYGDYILLQPPVDSEGVIVWLAPPL